MIGELGPVIVAAGLAGARFQGKIGLIFRWGCYVRPIGREGVLDHFVKGHQR